MNIEHVPDGALLYNISDSTTWVLHVILFSLKDDCITIVYVDISAWHRLFAFFGGPSMVPLSERLTRSLIHLLSIYLLPSPAHPGLHFS
jgi:hypothetical protein